MRHILLTVTSFILLATASSAGAASFDCSKVNSPDETAVCDNPILSELDTRMGALWFAYRRMPLLIGASGVRMDEAEAFLKRRGACGKDVSCLRKTYERRIHALENKIDDWLRTSMKTPENQQWTADTAPPAIQEIVEDYTGQCKELGGVLKPGFDKPMITTADLDGDGLQDFVLNPEQLQCSAAATAYCGNGGCNIALALSSEGYRNPTRILGGAPSLSHNQTDGTFLEVAVDRTNCDGTDTRNSCLEQYTWRDGKLSVSHKATVPQE